MNHQSNERPAWIGALTTLIVQASDCYPMSGLNGIPDQEWQGWTPMLPVDFALYAWDDPRYAESGGTVVQMCGSYSSYVHCFARIDWAASRLRLTRQDEKTEAMNGGVTLLITPEVLAALKQLRWPGSTQDAPWF
jgi:hypothetical protein